MKSSLYQLKKRADLKKQVVVLYQHGLTFRKIGAMLNRSHEWARKAYYELSTVEVLDKN